MAPLRYAAKFDPFLSLDCARVEGVGAQYKERKGSGNLVLVDNKPKIIVRYTTLVWMIFWPPAAAAATIMGFDVTMAFPAAATGEPGVLCTTITEGRFGVEGRNICEDEKCR